jgi:hypothetical protein
MAGNPQASAANGATDELHEFITSSPQSVSNPVADTAIPTFYQHKTASVSHSEIPVTPADEIIVKEPAAAAAVALGEALAPAANVEPTSDIQDPTKAKVVEEDIAPEDPASTVPAPEEANKATPPAVLDAAPEQAPSKSDAATPFSSLPESTAVQEVSDDESITTKDFQASKHLSVTAGGLKTRVDLTGNPSTYQSQHIEN